MNVVLILENDPLWVGLLARNDFSERIMAMGALPSERGLQRVFPRDLSDVDRTDVQVWLEQTYDIVVSPGIVGQAVSSVAARHHFHPVKDYLAGCKWDGVPRLGAWLTTYLGVEATDFARLVGPKWLISAVGRVMEPGCQADQTLILEGAQGIGKSSALRVLAGEWFSDHLPDLSNRDGMIELHGAWIVELAELEALGGSKITTVKAFLTRRVDRYRPIYGTSVVDIPRQCVFAGTTNSDTYLKDETGGRRFWPVRCGTIDLASLRRDRDQLWAEALVRFKAGDRWFLVGDEVKVAEVEQEARRDTDPWEELIKAYTSNRRQVTSDDVLEHAVGKASGTWTPYDQKRVAKVLIAIGFERKRLSTDGRPWVYQRC